MSFPEYPKGLRCALARPALSPRERRALSALGGMDQRGRAQSFDGARYTGVGYLYTPDEMETWLDWYTNELHDGLYWHLQQLPGLDGLQTRTVRFVGPVNREFAGGQGLWRLNAILEVREAVREAIVTSRLYPVDVLDAMASAARIRGLGFGPAIVVDGLDSSAEVTGLTLRDPVLEYSDAEALQAAAEVSGLSLRDLYRVYDRYDPEGLDVGGEITGLGFPNALITTEMLPEALQSGAAITGLTLQ